MSYKKLRNSYEKLQQVTNDLRKSYEKLRKVTKSYKRVIGNDLEASFSEILENGLPIRAPRQPKTKNQNRGTDRFRTSPKPSHRKNLKKQAAQPQAREGRRRPERRLPGVPQAEL